MAKNPWEASTVSMLNALKKEVLVDGVRVEDLQYTVLDNAKVTYRDAQELAEMHSINEKIPPKYLLKIALPIDLKDSPYMS